MPGIISESYTSRIFNLGTSPSRELVFDIQGTEDETEVQTLILSQAPSVYLGLQLDAIEAEPLGAGIWKGRAQYAHFDDGNEYTFDTGGGVQHMTQSLGTINAYAPPGFVPTNYKGAIGVDADRVQGVDVPAPKYEFSETHYFNDAAVTQAYKLALFNCTGCINDDTFKGFAAGECLFLGAAGSKRGTERWAITFRFSCQPNVSGVSMGDITGIEKFGWDYLWVQYATFEDSFAFNLAQRPIGVYIERVFRPVDFANLGINTF